MEKRGLSLTEIQEVPRNSLILLEGPPGAGKSTFCHQVVFNGLAAGRPVILVTSERSPAEVLGLINERNMGEPVGLNFVDAFSETVGLTPTPRSNVVQANCADLNSLSIAITKVQETIGQKGTLLVFDSLTSLYLSSGLEVVKFMRLFLSKFASEGNSVLACIDEGCGKEEDLVAMMSVADGIIRMEMKERSRIINVVKHPKVKLTRIKVHVESKQTELTREDTFRAIEAEVETLVGYSPKLISREIKSAGEYALYETRPLLWPLLIGPITLSIFGIVIYVVAGQFQLRLEGDFGQMLAQYTPMILGWVGVLTLVVGLLMVLIKWTRWSQTIYAITDRRILRQTGLIGRSYVDCSLERIQTVHLDMSIMGRICNFGTVRVATAGTPPTEIEWKGIKRPRDAQHLLNRAIEQYRQAKFE